MHEDGTSSKFMSFGYDCRAGFQIRRYFGTERCLRSIFDRLITPPEALYAYLENDFHGMFERPDIEERNGGIFHRRYGTHFHHEVKDAFRRSYEDGFAEHARLCKLTRDALINTPELTIAVHIMAPFPAPDELGFYLLKRYNRSMKVIAVRDEVPTTEQAEWRGNNHVWDEHLKSFGSPEKKTIWKWLARLNRKKAKRKFWQIEGCKGGFQ